MGVQYRSKLQPHRLLNLLVWGDYSWATWNGDRVTVRTAPLARLFRISRDRVGDYIDWLAEQRFVSDVVREKRQVTFTVRRPDRWSTMQLVVPEGSWVVENLL